MFTLLIALIFALAYIFSMLGLGGMMVYNPLMVWFGYDFKRVVVPADLLLNGLPAGSASLTYYQEVKLLACPARRPSDRRQEWRLS